MSDKDWVCGSTRTTTTTIKKMAKREKHRLKNSWKKTQKSSYAVHKFLSQKRRTHTHSAKNDRITNENCMEIFMPLFSAYSHPCVIGCLCAVPCSYVCVSAFICFDHSHLCIVYCCVETKLQSTSAYMRNARDYIYHACIVRISFCFIFFAQMFTLTMTFILFLRHEFF